jgi:uncharacterized membrane protein YeaQ/YmgE (transglycosylase-associated protein family)
MGLLVYLIVLAFSGLIVGALARLALPGPDPMSIGMTILIGIAGSFIGGLVMLAITGGRNAGGIIVSVAAATLIVYLMRRRRGGSLTDPGLGPRGPRERLAPAVAGGAANGIIERKAGGGGAGRGSSFSDARVLGVRSRVSRNSLWRPPRGWSVLGVI